MEEHKGGLFSSSLGPLLETWDSPLQYLSWVFRCCSWNLLEPLSQFGGHSPECSVQSISSWFICTAGSCQDLVIENITLSLLLWWLLDPVKGGSCGLLLDVLATELIILCDTSLLCHRECTLESGELILPASISLLYRFRTVPRSMSLCLAVSKLVVLLTHNSLSSSLSAASIAG